jgi:pimeloyl-ACP methyl ester carboxylesterase
MGAVPSMPKIYDPPTPPTYSYSRDITMLSTIDGHRIATREFSPFSVTDIIATVIFSHGNADDIGSCASYCQWLADSVCCRVVAYDYVNYGVSDAHEPSVDSMHHAIEAVLGYVMTKLREQPRNIFVVGKSLGSVPSVHLASQDYCADIAGVVLISPLASGARVLLGSTRLPARMMSVLDDQFAPNIKRIGHIRAPVLLVHGTKDKLINVQNSHDLYSAIQPCAAFPPLWVEAGHNDIESLHKGLFVSTVTSFVCHCMKRRAAAGENSEFL